MRSTDDWGSENDRVRVLEAGNRALGVTGHRRKCYGVH